MGLFGPTNNGGGSAPTPTPTPTLDDVLAAGNTSSTEIEAPLGNGDNVTVDPDNCYLVDPVDGVAVDWSVPGTVNLPGVLLTQGTGIGAYPTGFELVPLGNCLSIGYLGSGGYVLMQGYNYATSTLIPVQIEGASVGLSINNASPILMGNLPTSDPHRVNQVYQVDGALMVSAG